MDLKKQFWHLSDGIFKLRAENKIATVLWDEQFWT